MDPYAWSWDPDALAVVALLAIGYAATYRFHGPARWRVGCFALGLVLLLAVLVTPLDTIALHYLLSIHLLQNVVLAEWAPALVVLGVAPSLAARLARLPLARTLTRPAVALTLWLGNYFLWHAPPLYDAALRHPSSLLHLEHASYFGTGFLFWWSVFHDRPHAPSAPARALYLGLAFLLCSPLGLLLALLPEPSYDFYADAPRLWGLSRIEDQQFGGIAMATEQAVVLFAAGAWFFARFLREQDEQ